MPMYTETREASGELLRMILPLLSKQAAGFHPVSYAVWYEYVSGNNPKLKESIDALIASGTSLDDDMVYDLHEKFISKRDDAASIKLRSELERMLENLSKTATATGEHASAYSASLGGFGAQLQPGIDPNLLRGAVQGMIEKTEQMCERTSELETQLKDSGHEVAQLRAELMRAKDEALCDPLTGIANRRGLMAAFNHALSNQENGLGGSCLLAIDIDHFKKCNDTHGHLFGDKVIRAVAQTLTKMIKGQDTAARIGGEEFVVFLPDTPIGGASKLAEHIRNVIEAASIKNGNTLSKVTISLGVTDHVAGESIEDYMARADKALYASKSGGRNRVTVSLAPTKHRAPAAKPAAEDDPTAINPAVMRTSRIAKASLQPH